MDETQAWHSTVAAAAVVGASEAAPATAALRAISSSILRCRALVRVRNSDMVCSLGKRLWGAAKGPTAGTLQGGPAVARAAHPAPPRRSGVSETQVADERV